VATLLGHVKTDMVKRYAHLSNAHLRQAIEGLGAPNRKTVSHDCHTAARPGPKKKR
jgi:hypothetical protein